MKIKKLGLYASSVLMAAGVMAGSSALNVSADNPICQTAFTPDPAPVVFGDRLYVYTGRDRDGNNDFYYMNGYQVMSTTDMQNWTNHGGSSIRMIFPGARKIPTGLHSVLNETGSIISM
ncbi:MAG: hypothetical protein J6W65_04750 [Oscillospiraceae bacterium]|nr:hypothetical protein [Oscillospiraceae bacterium]